MRVEVEEGLALVALIGNDLSKACGVGKEVFGVLEPFNIRMICYGASSHNLCFLVPAKMPSRWCRSCILIYLSKHSMAEDIISGRIVFLVIMPINKRACTLLTSVFIGE